MVGGERLEHAADESAPDGVLRGAVESLPRLNTRALRPKLEGYAARLALVHHVVDAAGRGGLDDVPVEQASLEAGVTLCRWFAAEARRKGVDLISVGWITHSSAALDIGLDYLEFSAR